METTVPEILPEIVVPQSTYSGYSPDAEYIVNAVNSQANEILLFLWILVWLAFVWIAWKVTIFLYRSFIIGFIRKYIKFNI